MKLNQHDTVGDLVARNPQWAAAFERLGIDYCCGGHRPLDEACTQRGLKLDDVEAALSAVERPAEARDWRAESLTALADHIEQTHHVFLKSQLPRLTELIDKLVVVHGRRHGELADLREVFDGLRMELESHLQKEEIVLFPVIRKIEATEGPIEFHCGGGLDGPISVMEAEHDAAAEALQRMGELTGGYATPADGCATYRTTMDALAAVERDLHEHIHKANNILFPRAQALVAARG